MPPPHAGPPGDRRAAERQVCQCPCLVRFDRAHLDGGGGVVQAPAVLHDLSACGLSLRLRSWLPPGAVLGVEPLDQPAPALPPARVVRCVSAAGRWHLGCALARILMEDELRAWRS